MIPYPLFKLFVQLHIQNKQSTITRQRFFASLGQAVVYDESVRLVELNGTNPILLLRRLTYKFTTLLRSETNKHLSPIFVIVVILFLTVSYPQLYYWVPVQSFFLTSRKYFPVELSAVFLPSALLLKLQELDITGHNQ